MKKITLEENVTELVFILDRSGSMSGLESDTIGGFNAMVKKQKEEDGHVIVTTVLFDDQYELLHDRINIGAVNPITEKDYYVCGSTALLDAIGKTINKIDNVQKHTGKGFKATKVMFVITTDGMENASCEYSYAKIHQMITKQKKNHNWEFIFLGANIDAIATAAKFGIDKDRAVNYVPDQVGTALNYKVVNSAVSSYRKKQRLDSDWKAEIEKDFENRSN